jgi:hypothetical protein
MCSKNFGRFILWIWYSELRVEKEKSLAVPAGLFLSIGVALAAGQVGSATSTRERPPAKLHGFYYLALRAANKYRVFMYLREREN